VSDFTLILDQLRAGDATASERLLPLVYDELRRIAAAKMSRESAAQTLQPTALVHEAWLRLGGPADARWQNRRHFLGAAAEAMRRILIDRARQRQAVRHGGGLVRVEWDEQGQSAAPADDRLVALGEALDRLAAAHPEKAELVKLRYFTGLTLDEAAAALDTSPATAKRWWTFARAWLARELGRAGLAGPGEDS
jgi:RNA polymerase sigma factor (TIGR02999 family)